VSKSEYPTGVEKHGDSLRIWFLYRGKRIRENLGVPDTIKNRKVAGELRASVCFAIRMGTFDYAERFPNSPNLSKFGIQSKEVTVTDLASRWLDLKRLEASNNTLAGYESVIKNMLVLLGPKKLVSAVTQEDLLFIRKELLTGYQFIKKGQKKVIKGRKATTVNNYMVITGGMFQFAFDNGYVPKNPFDGISLLKKSKAEPDPLTRDEFFRLINASNNTQVKNLWSLAFYTGLRHGELCALAWEDIDLKAGTLIVRRNFTRVKEFTLPKTDSGTDRVVHLVQPAIDALKSQMPLTRLGKQYDIQVKLREYGRTIMHPCTFVFNPQLTRRAKDITESYHYSVCSIASSWDKVCRRAGIRHRKAYQSRHTYACWALAAGANPTFIATQMGHRNAQMVYNVYGAWMSENNADQVSMLNSRLSSFAPQMPHEGII
jgi:integrase